MQNAATYITAVFMVLSTAILGLIAWGMHGQFESLRNEFKQAIADALPNGKMIATASVGIIVCGDLEAAHDRQLSYLLQDCSAAMQNLLLAAHVLGLGACWLGIHPREDRIERLRQALALPANVIPIGGAAVGYPGEDKESRTRFNEQHVHRDRW